MPDISNKKKPYSPSIGLGIMYLHRKILKLEKLEKNENNKIKKLNLKKQINKFIKEKKLLIELKNKLS